MTNREISDDLQRAREKIRESGSPFSYWLLTCIQGDIDNDKDIFPTTLAIVKGLVKDFPGR